MTNNIERKPLLLAFLTGLCGNATLATLTSAHVTFSIFPIIAFAFAISALWQAYIAGPMEGDTPRCALALFFVVLSFVLSILLFNLSGFFNGL